MALSGVDLIAPAGEIEEVLFPDEDYTELILRLEYYLTDGYARASGLTDKIDDAARAWAYHRAYKAVYLRMSASPSETTLNDQGQAVFHKDQAERFLALSEEYLEEFEDLVGSGEVVDPLGSTKAFVNKYVF
jgi:hypothetical protein